MSKEGGATMKPFRVIVGEFDRFMREPHAICKHDRVLAAQIKEIARRHEEVNKRMPYAQSHADSAERMTAFMREVDECLKAHASELEGSPISKNELTGVSGGPRRARGAHEDHRPSRTWLSGVYPPSANSVRIPSMDVKRPNDLRLVS
jgi:hypothetical protein